MHRLYLTFLDIIEFFFFAQLQLKQAVPKAATMCFDPPRACDLNSQYQNKMLKNCCLSTTSNGDMTSHIKNSKNDER